jgi:hypothetical protein
MMDHRFILHIGRHKCGTTSLQRFLSGNIEQLKLNGYYYPRSAQDETDGAHHYLPRYFINRTRADLDKVDFELLKSKYEEFIQEINEVDIPVLLSSEAFQKVDPLKLPEVFARGNTQIIIYIREQVDYLMACYSQEIHEGRVTRSHQHYADSFSPDYAKFLQPWEERFGAQNISVRIFGKSDLKNGDIVSDFVDVLKIADERGFSYPELRSNPSIGGNLLYFKRLLNQTSISDDTLRRTYGVWQGLAVTNDKFRTKPKFSKQFVQRIRNRFEKSNEIIREKYFPDREVLFEYVTYEDELLAVEEADVLRDIWEILKFVEERRGVLVHELLGKLIFEYRTDERIGDLFNDFSKEL